ncbi:MAG: hypothetical protein A2X49_09025 [Lentisphaerae bacterium GWF2_52_8]|nr:MAG: hypothetical protein A2X49_09025 [Lentisphaerae bacterium GWF2_52_8]
MSLHIDTNFPGGNAIIERIEGDQIFLQQDLRDTQSDWFYWYCRVTGASGRTLHFNFTKSRALGGRGPAFSLDGGESWRYLSSLDEDGKGFSFSVPQGAQELRFSNTIPYLQTDWQKCLARLKKYSGWEEGVLAKSRSGRNVEMFRSGPSQKSKPFCLVLTARHHCCETIANFAMEGIIEGFLAQDKDGEFLRSKIDFAAIPFMDKDGSENGDQGKLRSPHDHNRDYLGESIYPEVAALRKFTPEWVGSRKLLFFDLHCPWISGKEQDRIFLVGQENQKIWQEFQNYGKILESINPGPLPFHMEHNVPYGCGWNKGIPSTCASWVSTLPQTLMSGTFELGYDDICGVEVTPDAFRAFGHTMAKALAQYLGAEADSK